MADIDPDPEPMTLTFAWDLPYFPVKVKRFIDEGHWQTSNRKEHKMKLSGEQIAALAEFADGDDCYITKPEKGILGSEVISRVTVRRVNDNTERVYLYENGQEERVAGDDNA